MRELRRFVHALRFATIVPMPGVEEIESDWLVRSAKYFPLVGIIVGLADAAVLVLASRVWGGALPALLAVTTGIMLTGALHEDGLADSADSLGGRTRERRLAIMTDSRIGTYGALALGIGVALRVAALATVPPLVGAAALVAAHAGARFISVVAMALSPYVGDVSASRIIQTGESPRPIELGVAALFAVAGVAPLAWIAPVPAAAAIVLAAAMALMVIKLSRALLGGHTGDVLGAIEQVSEIGALVGAACLIAPL